MKKAAILTFTYGDNFGQRLQNLALQTVLEELGCEVRTIRQAEKKVGSKRALKEYVKSLVGKSQYLRNRIRHAGFRQFDKRYISYYEKEISVEKIPGDLSDRFDYFVCGSDQIWSPFSTDVNETFFLTFAERKKRISYAASLAAEYIPEEKQDLYVRRLGNFDRISIREDKLSEWIAKNVGVMPEVHPDPTLLLDASFWSRIAQKPRHMCREDYVLCYCLGKKDKLRYYTEKYRLEGLRIIDLMGDEKYYFTRPDEFLYWILHAKAVITDSYHGTIFSVLFRIPFVVVNREGCEVDMSSRFETLLKMIGLSEGCNKNCEDMIFLDLKGDMQIAEKMKEAKERGREYLNQCLFSDKEL